MTDAATDEGSISGDGALRASERAVVAVVLSLIALLAATDLAIDLRDGVSGWHVAAEAGVATVACLGALALVRGEWLLRRLLEEHGRDFNAFRQLSEEWRSVSRKYLEGLSQSIDRQLGLWQLSAAEKEVAFLLLKGLSFKEIALARHTSEKTARIQSSAVYAKSGLGGRSELSAFFLEDLLPPAGD